MFLTEPTYLVRKFRPKIMKFNALSRSKLFSLDEASGIHHIAFVVNLCYSFLALILLKYEKM
jgi:hypothetical protein